MASVMARRLRDGADFLDMCARMDKTGEMDWTKPIIERRYTITETMRTAADRIELDEGALATAHAVFAAEIEGLHKIILNLNNRLELTFQFSRIKK